MKKLNVILYALLCICVACTFLIDKGYVKDILGFSWEVYCWSGAIVAFMLFILEVIKTIKGEE